MILHILARAEWEDAIKTGSYAPPTLGVEGFIHCSTIEQTAATANLFFKGRTDLVLLCIEESRVAGRLVFETPAAAGDARPDVRFPHVYGPLNLDAVIRSVDFPCRADGSFELPARLHSS